MVSEVDHIPIPRNFTFIEIQRPIHQNWLKRPLKQKGHFHRNCHVGTFIENEPRGGLLYGNELNYDSLVSLYVFASRDFQKFSRFVI